jgi:hypothetical protein
MMEDMDRISIWFWIIRIASCHGAGVHDIVILVPASSFGQDGMIFDDLGEEVWRSTGSGRGRL